MGLFSSKPKSFLGVDVGAGGIKIVELKAEKNRPVLFTYGLTSDYRDVHQLLLGKKSVAPDEINLEKTQNIRTEKKPIPTIDLSDARVEQYALAIKTICKEAKTVSTTAVCSLPVSAIFHTIVTLPKIGQKEFMGVLKAEIRKLLPYEIDEMVLDYQILEDFSTEKIKKVMVSAVPKSIIEFYSKVFKRAGLILESLEPESTALERSLIGRDKAVALIVDMGAERSNLFIIDRAIPITHHTIEAGGNKVNRILANELEVDEDDIGQIKHDLYKRFLSKSDDFIQKERFIEMMKPVIDPIVNQIEYSVGLYLGQTGNKEQRPEKIILTGGSAMIPFFADYLADKFKMKCFLGDPWARVVHQDQLKPLLNEIGPRMAVSIGLALKNIV